MSPSKFFALAALLLVGAINTWAQSPLDQSGFKKTTIGDEIRRGFDFASTRARERPSPNLTTMANELHDLAGSSSISAGFFLGAKLAELVVLDTILRSSGVGASNTAEEITDAARLGYVIRRDIRRVAESFSLSDEQLSRAVSRDFQGLLNRYDTGGDASVSRPESEETEASTPRPRAEETPLPEFPPMSAPEFVKLKKAFTLVDAKGRDVKKLPAGKRLRLVARNQETVSVDFFGKRFVIPADVVEPSE